MVRRYIYLLLGSLPRAVDLIYWPTVQMVLWGFMSQFLYTNSSYVAQAFGVLLAAVLLWDVFFRGQLGLALSYPGGDVVTQPRPSVREPVAPGRMGGLAADHELHAGSRSASYRRRCWRFRSIPTRSSALGLPLIAFFADLMIFAWALGLVTTALILRYGVAAENFAWSAVFLLAPVSAVYYPVSILPAWLQPVALALPTSHVFEGMRAVMFQHRISAGVRLPGPRAWTSLYVAIGAGIFMLAFRNARNRGALLQMGE